MGRRAPDTQGDCKKPKRVWAALCAAEEGKEQGGDKEQGEFENRQAPCDSSSASRRAASIKALPCTRKHNFPAPADPAPVHAPAAQAPPLVPQRSRKRTIFFDPVDPGPAAHEQRRLSPSASSGGIPRAAKIVRDPSLEAAAARSSEGEKSSAAASGGKRALVGASAGVASNEMQQPSQERGAVLAEDQAAEKRGKAGHKRCEHGRQKRHCRECPDGGTSLCEHKRQKNKCKECGGASICHHHRNRSECTDCRGGKICEHGRRRSECRECGGSQICTHDRKRSQCKECRGSAICEHNRRKTMCKDCKRAPQASTPRA